MPRRKPHKPASEARERIAALRAELHKLYEISEETGATVGRMEEISAEIREIQEGR